MLTPKQNAYILFCNTCINKSKCHNLFTYIEFVRAYICSHILIIKALRNLFTQKFALNPQKARERPIIEFSISLLLFLSYFQHPFFKPHQWHSGKAQNWKTRGAGFKPRSRLSTQPFGVFRGFTNQYQQPTNCFLKVKFYSISNKLCQ